MCKDTNLRKSIFLVNVLKTKFAIAYVMLSKTCVPAHTIITVDICIGIIKFRGWMQNTHNTYNLHIMISQCLQYWHATSIFKHTCRVAWIQNTIYNFVTLWCRLCHIICQIERNIDTHVACCVYTLYFHQRQMVRK